MKILSISTLIIALFVLTPLVTSADFSEGLVLNLSFDEGSGDVAEDLSGNGHDGIIDNPMWVDGKFGKALHFDGAGSGTFVTVESTDALNVNECTFMAWINAETWDGTRQIVGKSVHGGCSGRGPYGLFSERGVFKLRFETESGRADINADLPDTEKWLHVAFTNDGEMATIYVDGEIIAEGEIPGTLNTIEDPLRIAQDCERPNNVFAGIIDEVRLWNRALSQDDINILKELNSQVTPVDPLEKLSTTWGSLKSVR
jgi:hypothetical protein